MAKADVIEVVNSTNSKMSLKFARNSNTGGEIAAEPAEAHCAAVNRIYDDAAHPSRLLLLVIARHEI